MQGTEHMPMTGSHDQHMKWPRQAGSGQTRGNKASANMSPVTIVELTGAGWRLTGGEHRDLHVVVPVHALQALQDAGVVPDPLYRLFMFAISSRLSYQSSLEM